MAKHESKVIFALSKKGQEEFNNYLAQKSEADQEAIDDFLADPDICYKTRKKTEDVLYIWEDIDWDIYKSKGIEFIMQVRNRLPHNEFFFLEIPKNKDTLSARLPWDKIFAK